MRKSQLGALGALAASLTLSSGCSTDTVVAESPAPTVPQAGGPDPASQPSFGPIVNAASPPPPLSGGTMLVTHDGHTVVLSDPDRDQVYVVDTAAHELRATVPLLAGDEPGRLAEDGAGVVYVALRGSGALVTLDPASGSILARRPVCPAPRGLAWDRTTNAVYLACATGELVTIPCAPGTPPRTVTVERDLRDVVTRAGAISVSTFRSAELLDLANDGTVAKRVSVASAPTEPQGASTRPQVAWRTVLDASGNTVVLHQLHSTSSVPTGVAGGYGSDGIPSAVLTDLTVLRPDGSVMADSVLPAAVLPVDIAMSPDGKGALIAAPGAAFTQELQTAQYILLANPGLQLSTAVPRFPGAAIAVAFDGQGAALVQTREPATLWVFHVGASDKVAIPLSTVSRASTGFDVFHTQAGGHLACASCHPEGGDDGHVWALDDELRRTPSLRGTVAGTAPYHWPGDEADFPTLVNDVYTRRMSGAQLDTATLAALQTWVQAIPAPPAPSWVDSASAERGKALFESADAGCVSCHSGPKRTNNLTTDVGTGGEFQVPPLVGVGWRTPLFHDGRAPTLESRFTTFATRAHGSTASLSPANVSDLVSYLQTL